MNHTNFVKAMWECLENPEKFLNQDFTDEQLRMANLIVTIVRKKTIEKTAKGKQYTANDILGTYEYLNHKSMLQEGSYPKGIVREWQVKFKVFAKKRFICIDEIKEMPKKKFADVRIDSPN